MTDKVGQEGDSLNANDFICNIKSQLYLNLMQYMQHR